MTALAIAEEEESIGSTKSRPEVKEVIRICVESGMSVVLGESGKCAIFYFIDSFFGLASEDIADNPHRFRAALRDIFGPGAFVLENSILDELRGLSGTDDDLRARVRYFARVLEDGLFPSA